MFLNNLIFFTDTPQVSMNSIYPLPTPLPAKRRNVQRPPSMVYTSLESLNYICQHDRDANMNFDQEEPVAKWGRCRGGGKLEEITRAGVGVGEMEMIVIQIEEVSVQEQEEVQVQEQEEVQVQG